MHIFLNGGSYYDYLLNGGNDNLIDKLYPWLRSFLIGWNTYAFFWVLFMYVWDCLPPLLLSLLLTGDKPFLEKVKALIVADPYLPHVLISQIVSIAGYVIVSYIKRHSNLLASDLAYQDATGLSVFFLMLHFSLTTRISDTMRIVSRKTSSNSVKRSENQQPLLV
ncbi:hypothetical protein HDV06_005093 [Boothiomyces sp. JEL0866]|nr:hypothetical protein HDV06_005093 [Boothiomyces sp. JEL0866]